MKVTLKWLKEFLDADDLVPENVAEMLTMSGTEVETVEKIGKKFDNVIVGKILEYGPHPGADRLKLCRVDAGNRVLNIVCGADNFKKGDRVALALEGANIGGTIIRRSKIRGQYSEGMMCSEAELGLSSASDGIMILDDNCVIGEDFAVSQGLDDVVFELEITPNRPDCLSVIGIAREISAVTGIKLRIPRYDIRDSKSKDKDFKIIIDDYGLCPRYSAKIFKNIKQAGTPEWMKNRLMLCDIRPVSLMVDLTNYVMIETGQPMHAFDKDLLFSNTIIVRRAYDNEQIRTIDGVSRTLNKDSLVIADGKKAVAIAGIMGGKDTEINHATGNVLLESANFHGPSIMKTSALIGLRTEASNRFEKKIDPELTIFALERFSELLGDITGYSGEETVYDNYHKVERNRKISLKSTKITGILGQEIGLTNASKILESLQVKNTIKDGCIEAVVPSFRYEDLERDIDLIEEIARIYGYDRLTPQPAALSGNRGGCSFKQQKIRDIRRILSDNGLYEAVSYSFISAKEFSGFGLIKEEGFNNYVEIINPINEDFKYLRTTLLPSMTAIVKKNVYRNLKDVAIFEISRVFKKRSEEEPPAEPLMLGIVISGRAEKKAWDHEERLYDFYDIKGIVELVCRKINPYCEIRIKEKGYAFFHPRISAGIIINGRETGFTGKVHPAIIEELDIRQDIYYAEINLDVFIDNICPIMSFKPISDFPPVEIDIALVVEEGVKNADIEGIIRKDGTAALKEIRLFDIYRGEQVEKGKKSMAYSLLFRGDDRTLKDAEVDIIVNRILGDLKKEFGAKLRDT
ncbi:MAG: phenylalanine--tRNA ligase subunit beta [Actinobacteria bacterium]|nr:phenylalanine--tRNA ligase subunit beta [Actinomycetota bacterium]